MTDCVYVFSNPAMPGVVKIGMTRNGEKGVEKRRKDLSGTTGSPTPFICEGFVSTKNGYTLEKKAHTELRDKRVSRNREFFRVSPKKALDLLKELKSQELPAREEFRVNFNNFHFYRSALTNLPPSHGRLTVILLSEFHKVFKEIHDKKIKGSVARVFLEVARSLNSEASQLILAVSPLFCKIGDSIDAGYVRHDGKSWFFQGTKEEWEQLNEAVYGGLL
jgi:hypothetical protein